MRYRCTSAANENENERSVLNHGMEQKFFIKIGMVEEVSCERENLNDEIDSQRKLIVQ